MTPTGILQNIKKHQILRQAAVPTLDFFYEFYNYSTGKYVTQIVHLEQVSVRFIITNQQYKNHGRLDTCKKRISSTHHLKVTLKE